MEIDNITVEVDEATTPAKSTPAQPAVSQAPAAVPRSMNQLFLQRGNRNHPPQMKVLRLPQQPCTIPHELLRPAQQDILRRLPQRPEGCRKYKNKQTSQRFFRKNNMPIRAVTRQGQNLPAGCGLLQRRRADYFAERTNAGSEQGRRTQPEAYAMGPPSKRRIQSQANAGSAGRHSAVRDTQFTSTTVSSALRK